MKTKNIITIISFLTMLLFVGEPVMGQEETQEEEQEQERVQDRDEMAEEAQEQIENQERQQERAANRENRSDGRGFIDEDGDGFNDNAIEDVSEEDVVAEEGRESSQEGRNTAQENREQARDQQQNRRRFDNFIDENGDGFNDRRFGPEQGGMPEGIRDEVMDRVGNAPEQKKGQNGKPEGVEPGNGTPGSGRNNGNIPEEDGGTSGPPNGENDEKQGPPNNHGRN